MGAIIKSPKMLEPHALSSPFAAPPLPEPEVVSSVPAKFATTSETSALSLSSDTSLTSEAPSLPVASKESTPKVEPKEVENLDKLREQARQDGFKRGYAEAQNLVNEEFAELLATLKGLVQAGKLSLNQELHNNHSLMASIVFEAICKIMGDRLITLEGCKELLSHSIRDIQEEEIVVIKLSPRDLSMIEQADSTVREPFTRLPMEADPSVGLGGCIIQLRDGAIDARLETQMRMLAESLQEITGAS